MTLETELRSIGRYILVAYRWGNRNDHSYVVDLCEGVDTAIDRAEKETDETGGKYAVVVFGKRSDTGEMEEVFETQIPHHYKNGVYSENLSL